MKHAADATTLECRDDAGKDPTDTMRREKMKNLLLSLLQPLSSYTVSLSLCLFCVKLSSTR